MHELTPYRPESTLTGLSSQTRSFVGMISFPLIFAWWVVVGIGLFAPIFNMEGSPLACVAFIMLLVVLLGGTLAIHTGVGWLWRKAIRVKIDDPQVLTDTPSIRRGQTVHVTYIQPFKQQTALEGISIRLILREWVEYQRGTDTHTATHEEVFGEHTRPAQVMSAGQKLKEEVTFHIPANAMHSFSSEHNRLTWLVTVQTKIQTWPDMYEEYELTLSPGDH